MHVSDTKCTQWVVCAYVCVCVICNTIMTREVINLKDGEGNEIYKEREGRNDTIQYSCTKFSKNRNTDVQGLCAWVWYCLIPLADIWRLKTGLTWMCVYWVHSIYCEALGGTAHASGSQGVQKSWKEKFWDYFVNYRGHLGNHRKCWAHINVMFK